jgi:hypothetical protein
VQTLFALNRRYFLNEKRAVETIEGFDLRPEGFASTIREVLASIGQTPDALAESLARMEALVRATSALCDDDLG